MRRIAFIISCSLLVGCFSSEKDPDELCKSIPGMCGDLNIGDTHCKRDRGPLIRARYEAALTGRDLDKFKELEATKKFTRCMELSSVISATQLSDANARRMAALVHSSEQEELIMEMLTTSPEPEIIYYRWTQGDEFAKEQFLALEATEELDTPYLQLALAGHYINTDKMHAESILHRGLELVDNESSLEGELILSLATLYFQSDNVEQAYTWTMVAADFELTSGIDTLRRLKPLDETQIESLEQRASIITQEIKQGRYKRQ